jgi:hypothetical protein
MQNIQPLECFGGQFPLWIETILCECCEAVGGDPHETHMVHGFEVRDRGLCEQLVCFEPQVAQGAAKARVDATLKDFAIGKVEGAFHPKLKENAAQVGVQCANSGLER